MEHIIKIVQDKINEQRARGIDFIEFIIRYDRKPRKKIQKGNDKIKFVIDCKIFFYA